MVRHTGSPTTIHFARDRISRKPVDEVLGPPAAANGAAAAETEESPAVEEPVFDDFTQVEIEMTINEIRLKLPPEGQKWLKEMNRSELNATEVILNNVGETAFLQNWTRYKQDLQEVRNF